jgi:PAT family beta-lactamase induction signal transducer AmpG
MPDTKSRNAWFWVPSLYFSQGIPYVIVMTMSVVMYKRLGISNTDIALYTSWLYLPWVIKPLWSPLVDITHTKRAWVVAMQFLVALALALAAFSVRGSGFFQWSLLLFWIMAFASATHDIAADGFYMLSMSKHEQVWWVGLRSTFFRLAMIVGSGLLVVLAGVLESRNGLPPLEIPVSATLGSPVVSPGNPAEILFTEQPGALRIVAQPGALEIARRERTAAEAEVTIEAARKWNANHGFLSESLIAKDETKSWWATHGGRPLNQYLLAPLGRGWQSFVIQPLEGFLRTHLPKPSAGLKPTAGNIGVIYFALSKPPASGATIAINLEAKKTGLQFLGLAKGDQGLAVKQGGRLVFNATNWNQPALAVFQLDPKLRTDTTVRFQATSGNLPLAWSLTLFLVAGLFLAFSCWHTMMLPRLANDGPVVTHPRLASEFMATLGSFFQKPGIGLALAFILLYRFDEAQLSKVISPFLLDSRAAGGLGLATSQVGLAYGTFGVLALTCGGLLGGFLAARHGLKRMLPFMIGAMYLPKIMFLILAWTQPENFLATCGAVAVEQFGYGFGFTAFMLYLLYFADGPHKTAHYALCTGFMTLGMMIPGLWSGWLADLLGYQHFFAWVVCSTLPGLVLALQLKIDPQFGKRS